MLTNCRAAVKDELESNPKLSQELEQTIFGYLDDVANARSGRPDNAEEQERLALPEPPNAPEK